MLTANVLIAAGVGLAIALAVRGFIALAGRGGSAGKAPGYAAFGIIGALAGGIVGLYFLSDAGEAALGEIPSVAGMEEFRSEVLEADKPVVLDFYSITCGPCKALAPRLVELSEQYGDQVRFVKVNVRDKWAQPLLREYDVRGWPMVHLFIDGQSRRNWLGLHPKGDYAQGIEWALEHSRTQAPKDDAMTRTTGQITFKGDPLTLVGQERNVGDEAPDFVAVGNDLSPVKLSDFKGKTVIISSVPSLDTSVCATQTRKFNEQAGEKDDVVVLTVSMDLPFAQKRWCAAEGIENVVTVSDHRDADFGEKYGLVIKELRLLARAVFVVDAQGKITYKQIVDEMTDEPDYGAALAAAEAAS
jgi:thioredoxin-dependent peroxiredoxin